MDELIRRLRDQARVLDGDAVVMSHIAEYGDTPQQCIYADSATRYASLASELRQAADTITRLAAALEMLIESAETRDDVDLARAVPEARAALKEVGK